MRHLLLLASLLVAGPPASANEQSDVVAADARYWAAFNRCDLAAMDDLFTDDVEFYHDKTGLTESKAAVIASIAKGPCASPALKVRRELVPGSLSFAPLAGGYALLSGTHLFHATGADGKERLDGQAQFTLLWKSFGTHWQMRRVFSYGHGPVPYVPPVQRIDVPQATLQSLVGRYHDANAGDIDVALVDSALRVTSGSMVVNLRAQSATRFFAVERDLAFEFSASPGADGAHAKTRTTSAIILSVLERGEVVATAARVR